MIALAQQTNKEVELLLCCAIPHLTPARAERIRTLVKEPINWAYVLQQANFHGLTLLLYRSLNITCPEAVPNNILAILQDYFQANTHTSLFLIGNLLKLLNLFKTHSISVIPFKGPVLATVVYNNLALRRCGDLDILVHKQDFQKAKNLLISQGYELQVELEWEQHFVHKDNQVNVDLHQRILPKEWSFPLDFDYLWSRLQPISLAGTTVIAGLPLEDSLLIMCSQVAKDYRQGWDVLAKVCDIGAIICLHQQINWQIVIEQAKKLGSMRILLLSLLLVKELLEIDLPKEVLQKIQSTPVVKVLVNKLYSQLFREYYCPPTELEQHLLYFQMRERLQDKIWYIVTFVNFRLQILINPSPTDKAFLPLPNSCYFLYYLVRPIRVLVGFCKKLKRN